MVSLRQNMKFLLVTLDGSSETSALRMSDHECLDLLSNVTSSLPILE